MFLQLFFTDQLFFLAFIIAAMIAISIHEFGHAAMAVYLGDDTPRDQGRLTLNPLAHMTLEGFAMILLLGFGAARPVQFNPYNLRNQRWGPALIAVAGPLTNFIQAIIGAGAIYAAFYWFGIPLDNSMYIFFGAFILINSILMIFNLLPFPPLDGSRIFWGIFPNFMPEVKEFLEYNGIMIIFGLFLVEYVTRLPLLSALVGFFLNDFLGWLLQVMGISGLVIL
jgi:Zn-dependent protease